MFLPPANVVCEGYVFTHACHSVHMGGMRGCLGGQGVSCMVAPGGHAWLLLGGHAWLLRGGACVVALRGVWLLRGRHAWLLCGGAWLLWGACVVAPGGECAWDMTRYGDTVNEWAVRILLECILVSFFVCFFFLNDATLDLFFIDDLFRYLCATHCELKYVLVIFFISCISMSLFRQ